MLSVPENKSKEHNYVNLLNVAPRQGLRPCLTEISHGNLVL